MKPAMSAPGRLARVVVVQLLERLTGGTVRLVDPVRGRAFGDDTAPHARRLAIDVTVQRTRPRVRTRASCKRAASGSASPTPTAGGTPTTSPASCASRTGTCARTAHRTRPRAPLAATRRRSRRPATARRQAARRAQRPGALRPRERVLPAAARRDDDVLVRRVRVGRRDSLAEASRAQARSARAPARRSHPAIACSRSAPAGAASRSTPRRTTAATSRRRRSRQRQYEFARRACRGRGLEDRVTVLADDYRDLGGTFDKVIAIEMIEAVDWREYDTFFAAADVLLDDAAHWRCRRSSCPTRASTGPSATPTSSRAAIFPGGCLPSVAALTAAASRSGLHARAPRRHRPALRARRCAAGGTNLADARDDLDALGLDERFVRLWEFYFSYCEAGFDERYIRDCAAAVHARPAGARRRFAPRRPPRPLITVGGPELVRT